MPRKKKEEKKLEPLTIFISAPMKDKSPEEIESANCYKELKKENTELKEEISEWKKVSECDTPFQLNHLLTEINKKLQKLNQELRKLFC